MADEDSIVKIIGNAYDYVKECIDPGRPGGKEHIGYIVDHTGFEEFKKWALQTSSSTVRGGLLARLLGAASATAHRGKRTEKTAPGNGFRSRLMRS